VDVPIVADATRRPAIYHFHTDLVGTPLEVTDEQGELAWAGDYSAWGKARDASDLAMQSRIEQPLRFAGQYADDSTGLHYNTFRYYDPDVGRFISQDPIGLLGGENLYAYAPNPTGWIDPWGWCAWSTARKNFWKSEARTNASAYSPANLQRMANGTAPRMQVEVLKNGQRVIKDVSMELHHTNIPQRVGGPNVHNANNLSPLTPWQHEAVDPFRNTGETLLRVIKDVASW
jgi:RHS repeat-associated protein